MEKILRKMANTSVLRPIARKVKRTLVGPELPLLVREHPWKIFEEFFGGKYTYGYSDFGVDHFMQTGKKIYFLSDLDLPAVPSGFSKIKDLDALSDRQISESVFFVCFSTDDQAMQPIKRIIENKGIFVPDLDATKTSYRFTNSLTLNCLLEVDANPDLRPLFAGGIHFLENVCEAVDVTKGIEGDWVEIGVFEGDSLFTAARSIEMMSNLYKNFPKKKVWGLDTFHGFDYDESKTTSDVIWQGTHIVNEPEVQLNVIKRKLRDVDVDVRLSINNILADELPAEIKKISVAVIDVDLYEATVAAIEKVAPLIAIGGIIICEDAASTPQLYGSYVAMMEFLETETGKKFTKIFKKGSYFLLRTA